MVGAINPNTSQPLSIQRQNAGQARFALAPGEPFPSEGEEPAGNTAPKSPTSSDSPSSTQTVAAAAVHGSSLSGGAIAGIVIAAIFVVLLMGAVFFLLGRQKSMIQFLTRPRSKENLYQSMPPHAPSPQPPMGQYHVHGGTVYPDAQYGEQAFVAAPPYKHVSPPPPARTPSQQRALAHSPIELPSPGGHGIQQPIPGPTEPHPALREHYNPHYNHPRHNHNRTASTGISSVGVRRGIGSKSSAILGTSGSQRTAVNGGHVEGSDVSNFVPSPIPSPRPRSRDGPPQLKELRPLSWWTRKRSGRE